MDAGSLRDIINMAKRASKSAPYVEEPYLANIAYQVGICHLIKDY